MKMIITVCFAAMALSSFGETFYTEDGFSINLPDYWIQVPPAVLQNYEEQQVASEAIDDVSLVYDYGFQLDYGDGVWLTYPCILVQVQNVGRFSTGDLERFRQTAEGDAADLAEDKTLFLDIRTQGNIKTLVGRQLTEYGYIELTGFATVDQFESYESVFREAFSTLGIDELIKYKPQITDNAPVVGSVNLGKVLLIVVESALIGGVLWFVYSLVKRAVRKTKHA